MSTAREVDEPQNVVKLIVPGLMKRLARGLGMPGHPLSVVREAVSVRVRVRCIG